jgi:L,D-transpeptidase ErfK/SrfK
MPTDRNPRDFRKTACPRLRPNPFFLLTVCLFCGCLFFHSGPGQAYQPSWPVFSDVRGGEYIYVVKKNDSLYAISGKEGSSWQYLAEINNLLPPFNLSVGQKLTVNNRHIFPRTQLKEGLLLNIPGHMLYVFENGEISQRFPVGVGRPDWPTPTGVFRIISKVKNPTWTVPKSIQEEMMREGKMIMEKVPPGPDNPLGKYWLPLSIGGYGIHATPWPESIGHSTTHGCIRMVTKDIENLFTLIRPGTPLTIVYEPLKLAVNSDGKIFLETHPNTYQKAISYWNHIQNLARQNGLFDRIDWNKATLVLNKRHGIAEDITRK